MIKLPSILDSGLNPLMEVAGPTLPIKEKCHIGSVVLPAFLHGRPDGNRNRNRNVFCFEIADDDGGSSETSSSSSSIGVQSSSSSSSHQDGPEEDEVQSQISLDALQDALPIKRGLSNFFTGKSRSFQSLSEVSTAKVEVVAKPENPFNKRRRILMACKNSWSKRAKSYGSLLPPLPPLAALEGEEDDDDDDDDKDGESRGRPPLFPGGCHSKDDDRVVKKEFKSNRSFSLTDLQNA